MLRHNIKRIIANCWPKPTGARKIILLYHSVSHTRWAILPKMFAQQLFWLTQNCQILPLEQLITSESNGNIEVALTFDDGYASLYETVLPLLCQYNISATVYVNTRWLSDLTEQRNKAQPDLGFYPDEYFLTWAEVKQLQSNGWLIGSHGVNHLDFTKLTEDIIKQELSLSKKTIEAQLNSECLHFSYPWGRYSKHLAQILTDNGYYYAVAANHGAFTDHSHILSLPRINIANYYSLTDFKNIIIGKWDYLYWLHKLKGHQ